MGERGRKLYQKRGQVTVFIIIAVLVVAAVLGYLILKGTFENTEIPANIQPAYTSFLSCLEQEALTGINVLESQGGYIQLPSFEPGSKYSPFSSQLNFLGNPIPYWYYVSANNIPKEQVPSKSEMEKQLGDFVASKARNCDFNAYYDQGFEISLATPTSTDVSIKDNKVEITLHSDISIIKDVESARIKDHKISVDSKLGSLYASAKKVYDQEQKDLFLEKYAIDNIRLYAPVDGVEITCSPLVWNANDVYKDIQNATEANTVALSTKSNEKYFRVSIPNVDEEVRFLYSKNWPNSFEVTPSDGPLLISKPIGNQAGLGILGFCYVPYHYVYSVKYPILAQVYSGEETFQFPMAVVIQNNNPRESLNVTAPESVVPQLCTYKNTKVDVLVKDLRGLSVKANVSYECLGNTCSIGQTSDSGSLDDFFPQCANGYVVAKASGYKDTRYLFSTTSGGSVTVVMDKLYNKNIQLKVDGINYNGDAIIYFNSADSSQALLYPQEKTVQLAEGEYQVEVYIYKNSSINIGAQTTQQCINVPRSGPLGLFGLQQERCYNIEIPSQVISNALAGGGKQDFFPSESSLASANAIEINSKGLPLPDTIERLQDNNLLFEQNGLEINFK